MKEKDKFEQGRVGKTASTPQLASVAKRALAEAAERRSGREEVSPAKEIDGRAGPDPIRYGDWEVKGIASDF